MLRSTDALDVIGERLKFWMARNTWRVVEPIVESVVGGEISSRYRGAILIDEIGTQAKYVGFGLVAEQMKRYRGLRLAYAKDRWILIRAEFAPENNGDWFATEILEVGPGDAGAATKLLANIDLGDIVLASIVLGKHCESRLLQGVERHQNDVRMIADLAKSELTVIALNSEASGTGRKE